MVELRSGSKKGNDSVVASKGVNKVLKGRTVKSKISKKTMVNIPIQNLSTPGHSDVSEASLPSLQSPSGFGFVAPGPSHFTGYVAQAAKVVHNILPPTSFSGDVDQWPHYSRTVQNFVRNMIGRRDIDLMSEVGYDEQTEALIYEHLCTTMNWKVYNKINPRFSDKGTKAFQFLDTSYRGTRQMRTHKCIQRLSTICYIWGESPTDYVAELTRLINESAILEIHTPGTPNSLATYINTQTAKLPTPELSDLQSRLQRRYREFGYPTEIAHFTDEFTHEINCLKENGLFANTTRVSVAATANNNPSTSNNQVKKRKKKVQVSIANTAPVPPPPQRPTYQPNEPQNNQGGYSGRGRGGRGGRGSNQRGRGAPKRSDFYNYNEWNSWQPNHKPTCLKCGSSRDQHIARDCRSQVWCNNCRTDNHGLRACRWL